MSIDCILRVSEKHDHTQGSGVTFVAEYLNPNNPSIVYCEAWGFTREEAKGRLPEGYNVAPCL